MAQVSDIEVLTAVEKDFAGNLMFAKEYCERIAAIKGPLAEQYERVAMMFESRIAKRNRADAHEE